MTSPRSSLGLAHGTKGRPRIAAQIQLVVNTQWLSLRDHELHLLPFKKKFHLSVKMHGRFADIVFISSVRDVTGKSQGLYLYFAIDTIFVTKCFI